MAPLSVRMTQEEKDRLEDAAARLGISPHTLARLAIEAGITAIERDETIVMPIEFDVTRIAMGRPVQETRYPKGNQERALAEEKSEHAKYPSAGEKMADKFYEEGISSYAARADAAAGGTGSGTGPSQPAAPAAAPSAKVPSRSTGRARHARPGKSSKHK